MTSFIDRTLKKINAITRQRHIKNLKNLEALALNPEKLIQHGILGCLMVSSVLWCSESAFASAANSDIITTIDTSSGSLLGILKGNIFHVTYGIGSIVGIVAAYVSAGIGVSLRVAGIAFIGIFILKTIFGTKF